MARLNMRTQLLFFSLVLVLVLVLRIDGAEGRIEDQFRAIGLVEVEHIHDRAGGGVEGAPADTFTLQPVVLDELRDRGLRDEHVADVVLLGVGRDHHERGTRTWAAASSDRQAVDPGGFSCTDSAADAGAV